MTNKLILSFILIHAVITSFGQNNYYSRNGSTFFGVELIESDEVTNSKYCQVKEKEETKRYTPYEVSEYGFKSGKEYFSREIRLNDTLIKVFLERLSKGTISLYYYHGPHDKKLYIEKDKSGLIELTKDSLPGISEDYRTVIARYANLCKGSAEALKEVRYTKKAITKYFKQYEYCDFKAMSYFRYGITLGYSSYNLKYSHDIEIQMIRDMDYKPDKSFAIGLFIDYPIFMSDFSIHSDLYLTKHGFSLNKRDQSADVDFVVNTTSLILPVMLRYTIPTNKIRPFINLGANFLYNVKNENTYYEAIIDNNIITLNKLSEKKYTSDFMLGYNFGGGLEYKINSKNSLFLELHYSNFKDISNTGKFKTSEFLINTGISF